MSDLYTPTNVDYLVLTLTPLVYSRYLGLCLNFWSGPCDFSVSPNSSIFFFWRTFIQLGDLLGHGLGPGLGPGLDNFDL